MRAFKITFDNLLNAIIYYTFYLAGDIACLASGQNLLTKFISRRGQGTTEKNMKNCSLLESFLSTNFFAGVAKFLSCFDFGKVFRCNKSATRVILGIYATSEDQLVAISKRVLFNIFSDLKKSLKV